MLSSYFRSSFGRVSGGLTNHGAQFWAQYDGGLAPVLSAPFAFGTVVYRSGTYYLFNHEDDDTIALYTSTDGEGFTKHSVILTATETWEGGKVGVPQVWEEGGTWHMLYRGIPDEDATGYASASSPEGPWSKYESNPVIHPDLNASWPPSGSEATGVIKVGSTYYAYPEAGGGWSRSVGVATSDDLTTWAYHTRSPMFNRGRFCPDVIKWSGLYFMLLPHFTVDGDKAELELYRSPRPTFLPEERELLKVVFTCPDEGWNSGDSDTPHVMTTDITRSELLNDVLRCYFAGTESGGYDDGGYGLLVSDRPDIALDTLKGHALLDIAKADWDAGTKANVRVVDDCLVPGSVVDEISQEIGAMEASSFGANATKRLGNTFTLADTADGVTIDTLVSLSSTLMSTVPEHGVTCELYAASGNLPTGSPLATATDYLAHPNGWLSFDFPGVSLEAGQYAYAIRATTAESVGNIYLVRANADGGYTGGRFVQSNDGSTWSSNNSVDCAFRVRSWTTAASGTFESQELSLSGTADGRTRIAWEQSGGVTLEANVALDGENYAGWQVVANGGAIPGIDASDDLSAATVKYRATVPTGARLDSVLLEVGTD